VSRFQEVSALETEVTNLKDRLEVRKLLDRAKGLLQAERGMTEAEAFRWIQKSSMDRRMTMRAVAEEVLQGAQASAPDPADSQSRDPGEAQPRARESGASQASERKSGASEPSGGKSGPGKTGRGKAAAGEAGEKPPTASEAGEGRS
jgi:two-component system, response regulator PdtaR